MEKTEDDLAAVKEYLSRFYEHARPSSWRVYMLDKSQALVTSATLSVVMLFLWCATMTGMWAWGIYPEMSIGFTLFCGSFVWSSIRLCHILPGKTLDCPPNFRWAQCISWYDPHFPYSTTIISEMQVISILGLLTAIINTTLSFYTICQVKDHYIVRKCMKIGLVFSLVNAIFALVTFSLFLNFHYADMIFEGKGCILIKMEGGIECLDVSNFPHPIGKGFAFSTTVINFIAGLMCTVSFAMGTRIENFDIDKEA